MKRKEADCARSGAYLGNICQIVGEERQMTTIIYGNENNLSVSDDNSNGDTIIVGNGIDDFVSANNSSNDMIIGIRMLAFG